MKNIVLKISNSNWGLIGPGSWKEKNWIIYDDMSVDYTILYNLPENNMKTLNFEFTKDEFDKIIDNIELAKNDNTIVDANDGEAWEFVKYNEGAEIWKRKQGYIYGISPLENIADILLKK